MRLIDADDLVAKIMMDAPDFLDGGSSITKAFIMAMVRTKIATPTIDAVPIVRCKDCKHRDPEDGRCDSGHGIRWNLPRPDDWFCADGERKEGR